MTSSFFTRLPVTSSAAARANAAAAAAPPSPPSSLSRLPSLSRQRSSVPSELQPALSDLLSLHSQIDSALLQLDSCTSLAALSAASLEVKQRIAQLQQRIAAVQAEVELEQHRHQHEPHNQHSNDNRAVPVTAAKLAPSHSSATHPTTVTATTATATAAASHSVDPYDSVDALLAQHSVIAGSYSNSLRQRLLTCRSQLAAQSKHIRRELFASQHSAPAPSQPASALDRQRQFTASLHNTHSLLQSSLSLTAASLDSLAASTDTLRSTQRHSAVHSEVVKGGSKIITKQMQRQRTDRLLVWCGLAFFLLVCVYITNRRLRITRILAFLSRTLLPNMYSYIGHGSQQQPQQYTQYEQHWPSTEQRTD